MSFSLFPVSISQSACNACGNLSVCMHMHVPILKMRALHVCKHEFGQRDAMVWLQCHEHKRATMSSSSAKRGGGRNVGFHVCFSIL